MSICVLFLASVYRVRQRPRFRLLHLTACEYDVMVEGRQVRTPDVGRATTLEGRECSGRRSMTAMISEKGLTPGVCACQLRSYPGPGTQEEVKAVRDLRR